ncbi:hypothetical protein G4B84_001493 [Aspergillus flavus NRRL3357]|nr:uncharacterized protein G4B84_001493 [Aspergillus flavus NRRL3357]QMW26248.1 hypothetical protein G4B84_001493 [Aspergillus flavus NRRL3357]QMW38330.1 hypothetical protein G4B11_001566 [Aspergillus flavus]
MGICANPISKLCELQKGKTKYVSFDELTHTFNRHCFRRAASRLLFSTPRSTWATSSNLRIAIPRQTSHLLQSRWNSQHVPSQPDLASKDAATTNENDEQLIQAAVGYMEGTSTPANETVDHISKKSEAQPQPTEEESKRAKRLRLLNKEPDPKETVFVGNLFYDVTADDLRKQMEKYGVVESVYITFDNRGMSKGFGYVQFDSIDSARRAIDAMHMRVYEGRRVIVAFAQNNIDQHRNLRPISRTLYLGNLPFEMTDRDINELFRDIVNVIDVRVSVDRRTGMFRGFAHAEFINVESARAAFEILSRKAPYGRKLRLDYSQTNRRADRLEDNTE